MLQSLSIRDVVLIDRLDLDCRPGLSVLTGETGAAVQVQPVDQHHVADR
jgi:DNA repair protein RecN (Recombination protein N)